MRVKRKKNNDLVLMHVGDKNLYFTSNTFAGQHIGLHATSVDWAIKHKKTLWTTDDEPITIEIVDGSEIPYKLINNN